jgi:dipeptidyl aminopeptidase/acylaminoacyl peptidase
MTDRLDFETRLEERIRARAALASRPFDAAAIARQVVAVNGRRRRFGRLEWPSTRPALGWLVLALLLAIAVLGAVAAVGALLRERPLWPMSVVSNGRIVVSANPNDVGGGEVGDIYLVSEGAAARRIVGSEGDGVAQACPRFSPDGRRLAYGEAHASEPVTTFRGVWPVTDRAVVVVGINVGGDATPPIARVPISATGPVSCPEWSPVGGQLAFRVGTELWVSDAASGETRAFPVTAQSGFEQDEFEWSRDGARIAVAEPGQIRVVRLDDGSSTVIPVDGATPASLGWTAGDDRIVYFSTDPPGDGLAVHVVGADGRNDTQLAPDPTDPADPQIQFDVADAVVSPDGIRVAYAYHVIRCTSDSCTGDPERLLTMDLDGSNVVEVPIPPDFFVSGLQWSPDGQRLLFGSIAGVVSVAAAPGSPAIVHSNGELNLEWSGSEVTWQPVFK